MEEDMFIGQVLWIGSAILMFFSFLAGDWKWLMIFFGGVLLGVFLRFDIPKIFPNHFEDPTVEVQDVDVR
jgi:hypothetical protein